VRLPLYRRSPATSGRGAREHAVVLDAETMPYVDVTAVRMLAELARDLQHDGIRLVVARNIGQVREVIRTAGEEAVIPVYPTVQEAVDAVRQPGEGRDGSAPRND
jgi:anti-anti-sigma factor